MCYAQKLRNCHKDKRGGAWRAQVACLHVNYEASWAPVVLLLRDCRQLDPITQQKNSGRRAWSLRAAALYWRAQGDAENAEGDWRAFANTQVNYEKTWSWSGKADIGGDKKTTKRNATLRGLPFVPTAEVRTVTGLKKALPSRGRCLPPGAHSPPHSARQWRLTLRHPPGSSRPAAQSSLLPWRAVTQENFSRLQSKDKTQQRLSDATTTVSQTACIQSVRMMSSTVQLRPGMAWMEWWRVRTS